MISKFRQSLLIVAALIVIMMVTRGSHVGDAASLPDATLACMLLGGVLLRRGAWFGLMLVVGVAIDAFAVGVAGVSSYCLSPAYWALLPTYATLWLGGLWLARRTDAFAPLPYVLTGCAATTVAFLISTDSFYIFSGKFPQASLWEVVQHGWEYYPAYLGYTMMYLGAAWAVRRVIGIANGERTTQTV